ncbi:glycosyl transferase, partial [Streptomyces sp. SID8382]|nr:glycosyl transferase [Streptomyces sp. SID8382]
RHQAAAGPLRFPVPDALDRYDIARAARRLMDLYDRTTTCGPDGCLRVPSAGRRMPRRGAPAG